MKLFTASFISFAYSVYNFSEDFLELALVIILLCKTSPRIALKKRRSVDFLPDTAAIFLLSLASSTSAMKYFAKISKCLLFLNASSVTNGLPSLPNISSCILIACSIEASPGTRFRYIPPALRLISCINLCLADSLEDSFFLPVCSSTVPSMNTGFIRFSVPEIRPPSPSSDRSNILSNITLLFLVNTSVNK